MDISLGSLLENRYLVQNIIGSGGMGTVYQSLDQELNRQVAIKVLHNWQATEFDKTNILRFEREAKALSQLIHPNIVRVFRYGYLDQNTPYLVMEYVQGQSLKDLLKKKYSLSCQESVEISLPIASALEYAHKQGIVHRDLKPENIVIESENLKSIKLLDFGLCTFDDEQNSGSKSHTLTKTGFLVGTVFYMSPEQCLGKKVDLRTDIYSFGCILYEMICGEAPFTDENQTQILLKHIQEPMAKLQDISPNSNFPAQLQDLIDNCTQKDLNKRAQNFSEIINFLHEISALSSQARLIKDDFSRVKSKKKKQTINYKKLFITIFCCTLIVICFCLGLASFVIFTEYGRLQLITQSQNLLPAHQYFELLNKIISTLIQNNKTIEINHLIRSSINSESFKFWQQEDRLQLIYLCNKILKNLPNNTEKFQSSLQLLNKNIEEVRLLFQKNESIPQECKEIVISLSSYLDTQAKTQAQWADIAKTLKRQKDLIRKKRFEFLAYFGELFGDAEQFGSKLIPRDKAALIADQYLYSIYLKPYNVALRIALKGIAFCQKMHLPYYEHRIRLSLAEIYLDNNERNKALSELNNAENILGDIPLSHGEMETLRDLQIKCRGKLNPAFIERTTPPKYNKILPEAEDLLGKPNEQ